MNAVQAIPVQVEAHDQIPDGMRELAAEKVSSLLRFASEPVLSARVTLAVSRTLPSAAARGRAGQYRPERAARSGRRLTAATMRDAIEALVRQSSGSSLSGPHGTGRGSAVVSRASQPRPRSPASGGIRAVPSPRLPYFPRPIDERGGVPRHKLTGCLPADAGRGRRRPGAARLRLPLVHRAVHQPGQRPSTAPADGYRMAQVHPRGPSSLGTLHNAFTVSEMPAPQAS